MRKKYWKTGTKAATAVVSYPEIIGTFYQQIVLKYYPLRIVKLKKIITSPPPSGVIQAEKINLGWIIGLSIKAKVTNLEKTIGECLFDYG